MYFEQPPPPNPPPTNKTLGIVAATSLLIGTAFLIATGGPTASLSVSTSLEHPREALDLNIQAVLELESMEDIVWNHIPDADQSAIVEKWFWDSMGCWYEGFWFFGWVLDWGGGKCIPKRR